MIKKTHRFLFYIIVSAIGLVFNPIYAFAGSPGGSPGSGNEVDFNVPLFDSNQSGTGALTYVGGKIINLLLINAFVS